MDQSAIKKSQKESVLFRALSSLFMQIVQDDSRLMGLTLNRVELTKNKSSCKVFFWTPNGVQEFQEKLPILILYKPSLRGAIAKMLNLRYTPELIFLYDAIYDKQEKVEKLLNQIKEEE